ncbi:MAG: 50S ribosome-binding GTPase [Ruminococcus sp.]|uniref:GTPase n=1 Tax=Ruminococcus sp. TaxID=41978 RepID=UPI0025EFB481|nr:GTPase [Ruminococcus sp.]MCR5600896.1 50S ribosome-binding GTPase [Ruminococcus sp.]
MNHLFYLIGKSSSGKDTLYRRIVEELGLIPAVLYTTRPIRDNEHEGKEYHFVDEAGFLRMKDQGKVIEYRTYDTVYGKWTYFTAADSILLGDGNCIGIGTLESYVKVRSYYENGTVVPLYIEVDDDTRFLRAVEREKGQSKPKYLELCRRFVADSIDFSEEKLKEAGITHRFDNSGTTEQCFSEIKKYISDITED